LRQRHAPRLVSASSAAAGRKKLKLVPERPLHGERDIFQRREPRQIEVIWMTPVAAARASWIGTCVTSSPPNHDMARIGREQTGDLVDSRWSCRRPRTDHGVQFAPASRRASRRR